MNEHFPEQDRPQDQQQQQHQQSQHHGQGQRQSSANPYPPPVRHSPEDWEQVRRSVAMLRPGAWAMKREQALQALDSLVGEMRRGRGQSPPG